MTQKIAGGTVALVFGREDCGLHTAELDLCQRLLTIPTQWISVDESRPSDNGVPERTRPRFRAPRALMSSHASWREELEAMLQHMRRNLD